MGRFDDVLNNKTLDTSEKTVIKFNQSTDPRPDLTRDSIYWQQLFAVAVENTAVPDLFAALKYLRARGTHLVRMADGRLRPFPVIDPTGCDGWESQGEYDREKIRIFGPPDGPNEVGRALVELLGKFRNEPKGTAA